RPVRDRQAFHPLTAIYRFKAPLRFKVDLGIRSSGKSPQTAPLRAPISGEFILIAIHLVSSIRIAVIAVKITERNTDITKTAGFNLDTSRGAKAGYVVAVGLAAILGQIPYRLLQPEPPAALIAIRCDRIGEEPGRGTRTLTDRGKNTAGMIGQHLLYRFIKCLGRSRAKEAGRNGSVIIQHSKNRVIGAGLRAGEVHFLGGLAFNINPDSAFIFVTRNAAFEHIGLDDAVGFQIVAARQGSGVDYLIPPF